MTSSVAALLLWHGETKRLKCIIIFIMLFKLFKTMGEVAGISWLSIDGGTH
jgi:hypothetical protein